VFFKLATEFDILNLMGWQECSRQKKTW